MAGKLTSSQLIRFSAAAGSGEDDDAEDAVAIELVTELKGVVSRAASTCRLCAALLIEFVVRGLCARVRLAGIAPGNHEPLKLTLASYGGTTCGYAGPIDGAEPFRALVGYPCTDQDHGETLVITYPRQLDDADAPRITEYVGPLPRPVLDYVPPLQTGEPDPFEATYPLRALLNGLNARRGEQGLSVLGWDTELADALADHLDFLIEEFPDYCAGAEPPPGWSPHEGSAGEETPHERATAAGYPSEETVGELLHLIGPRTPAEVLDAWWDDPVTRALWVGPDWQALGAARVAIPGEPGDWVWGVLLGSVYRPEHGTLADGGALRRVAFCSLDALGDEQGEGVRLPMRLIGTRAGHTGEVEAKALTYADAPGFTVGDNLIHTNKDPVWSVTGQELAEALQTPETSPDEITDWDLWWRIYKGSGRMVYALVCDGSEVASRAVDTRDAGLGGGLGTVMTTDLLAARVRVEPSPYLWLIELSTGERINADCVDETHWRQAPAEWIGMGAGDWRRASDGLLVMRQWMGGREVPRLVPPGLQAYQIAIAASCAIRDGDGVEVFQYLTGRNEDWGTYGRVYRRPLLADAQPVLMADLGLPQRADGRWPDVLTFSGDGLSVLAVANGGLGTDPADLTHVWIATLSEVRVPDPAPTDPDRTAIRLASSGWVLRYVQPALLIDDVSFSDSGVQDVDWHQTGIHNGVGIFETSHSHHASQSYRWRLAYVSGVAWRENEPVLIEYEYTAVQSRAISEDTSGSERAVWPEPEGGWPAGYPADGPWDVVTTGGEHHTSSASLDLVIRARVLGAAPAGTDLLSVRLINAAHQHDREHAGAWTRTPSANAQGDALCSVRGSCGPERPPAEVRVDQWRALRVSASARLGAITHALESGRLDFAYSGPLLNVNPTYTDYDYVARMWVGGAIGGAPTAEVDLWTVDAWMGRFLPAPPGIGGFLAAPTEAQLRAAATEQMAFWRDVGIATGRTWEQPGPAGGPVIWEFAKRTQATEFAPWVETALERGCVGGELPGPLAVQPPRIVRCEFITPRACIDHAPPAH